MLSTPRFATEEGSSADDQTVQLGCAVEVLTNRSTSESAIRIAVLKGLIIPRLPHAAQD